ncbi:drug/metabolite exporter YedA [Thermogemmatispora sp.]|uniref:drug/metabolite exporter YedA n=1 Tax=Thermogemmatispora sp. TaxID=1968838 RepID=UPI002606D9DB|nr:drug/metabolite exporter YedA [Thermogemmatispora sp.]
MATSPERSGAAAARQRQGSLRPVDRLGIILALLALYLIWGSTYLGMRQALTSFPPFLMGGLRFVCAGILLYLFLRLRGEPRPSRRQWLAGAGIGVLMLVGSNGMVAFAEQWVASGLAAIALAAVPLWTALFAGLSGRWPRRLEWSGLLLGFAGVILLNLQSGLRANPQGAIALLIAPICWSLGSVWSTRLPLASGLMASATQMLAGGLAQLSIGLLLGERPSLPPAPGALLSLIYLVGAGSLLGYCAYGYLLRRVRPALATSYAYVNPLVAVFLGVLFAHEQVTPLELLAMLIILGSVALISLQPRSAPTSPTHLSKASVPDQNQAQQISQAEIEMRGER